MKRLVGLLHSSGQSSAEPDVPAHPTPIWISKRTRTALILAVVVVLGFVIWYVPSVLTTRPWNASARRLCARAIG